MFIIKARCPAECSIFGDTVVVCGIEDTAMASYGALKGKRNVVYMATEFVHIHSPNIYPTFMSTVYAL